MRILIVAAADETQATTGHQSVPHLAQVIGAYYVLRDAGAEIVIASRAGGAPLIGRVNDEDGLPVALRERFKGDQLAYDEMTDTLCLRKVCETDFGAVLCIGLAGVDGCVPDDDVVLVLLRAFLASGKPVALISSVFPEVHETVGVGSLIFGKSVGSAIFAANALLSGSR